MSMSKYYIYKMNILDDPLYFGSYIGQHKIGKKEPMKDGYKGSGRQWKKYILSNHVLVEKEILCLCESIEEANKMEQFYIEQYKNDGIYLWNRCKGGGGYDHDRVYTEEELKEHQRQRKKQWYESHKEHITEYGKRYNETHKEHRKQYLEANKEHIAERTKRYNEAHKEHYKQIWTQYRETHKEHIAKRTKQYREAHKEHYKQLMKQYGSQLCNYDGEILTLNALRYRFSRMGVEHPVLEAKKYLVQEVA